MILAIGMICGAATFAGCKKDKKDDNKQSSSQEYSEKESDEDTESDEDDDAPSDYNSFVTSDDNVVEVPEGGAGWEGDW
jgi:hypothetical protein